MSTSTGRVRDIHLISQTQLVALQLEGQYADVVGAKRQKKKLADENRQRYDVDIPASPNVRGEGDEDAK